MLISHKSSVAKPSDNEITALITAITTQGIACDRAQLKYLLDAFGIHLLNTRIITITGTNGKGTTVALLKHLFTHNRQSFIAHTSPHILRFNERISDGIESISNQDL